MNTKYKISKEQEKVNNIRKLYDQMVAAGRDEKEEVQKLTKQVLAYQREDGSFCAADTIPTESDCRIFYYYVPTYYATAALMNAMLKGDKRTEEMVGHALNLGLSVAMQRKLIGHGYDATQQQLNALKIFKDAGMYECELPSILRLKLPVLCSFYKTGSFCYSFTSLSTSMPSTTYCKISS